MCPNGNAERTRKIILDAAIKIVSQHGLDELTAGRLIQQARVSKGGLYHHFRTMSEVESEVLILLSENIRIKLSAYPKPDSMSEFMDVVEQELFECFVTESDEAKALFSFISSAAHNREIQVILRQLMDTINLQRLQQLQAVSAGVHFAQLQNTVQIISTVQTGLMTRFFIAEDLTSLKNYWRGCRGMLENLLGISAEAPLPEQSVEPQVNVMPMASTNLN